MKDGFETVVNDSFLNAEGNWDYCWNRYPKSQSARETCMKEREAADAAAKDDKKAAWTGRKGKILDFGLDWLTGKITKPQGDSPDIDFDDKPTEKNYTPLYIGLGLLAAAGVGFAIYKASKSK